MNSGLVPHSPAAVQAAQAVSFLSAHVLESHTEHEAGHSFIMKCALSRHSPRAAQEGQNVWRSLHLSLQTPHETGQDRRENSKFNSHIPSLAHNWHGDSVAAGPICIPPFESLQTGEQTPHAVGHSRNMKDGLLSHSPACCHAVQLVDKSVQLWEQMPQEDGHVLCMNSALLSHSPSFAQPPHPTTLSEHKAAAEGSRRMRNRGIIV